MKTTTSYSFHALFLALSFLLVAPALGQQPDRVGTREVKTAQWRGKHIQYAEGKVSVKLKEGANKGVARNAVQAVVGRTLQDFDELGWGFFEVPEDQSVLDVVSELEKLPSVSIAHPVSVGTIGTTPDDDFLSNQWGLINTSQNAGTADSDIDADLAWDHTTGSSDVVIAVLDTGIPMQGGSLSHNDLDDPNKIILGPDYTDETDGTVQDNHGHGTHVAGIAAAETNNDKGVAGTCWSCKMLVVQTNLGEPLENLPAGYYEADWFYNGVKYASDYKTNNPGTEFVINFSSGGPNDDPVYHDAIEYARDRGVLIVSIAHNDNGGDVRYPAALSDDYNNMVAVSATDHNDNFASYSNSGPEVNVAAPGGYGASDSRSIYSTLPDYSTTGYGSTNYGYSYGTSMAAPMVAGTAALMLSIEPFLSPNEVRDLLESEATDVNGGGFDNELGHGRINALNAVTEAAEPAAPTNLTITNADQTGQHPNLDWDDNSEPDIDHYNVERCTSYYTSCNWSKIAETTTSDYTDTWVSIQDKENADHEYTYQVLAVDTDSYSSFPSKLVSVWGIEPHSSEPQYAEAPAVPDTFALRAPTPNPTADRARLRVHVPEARTVTVVVHDLMGREVARLADRRMRPGIHSLTVQARQWPSAVYLVRMRAGQFSATERLTVVR